MHRIALLAWQGTRVSQRCCGGACGLAPPGFCSCVAEPGACTRVRCIHMYGMPSCIGLSRHRDSAINIRWCRCAPSTATLPVHCSLFVGHQRATRALSIVRAVWWPWPQGSTQSVVFTFACAWRRLCVCLQQVHVLCTVAALFTTISLRAAGARCCQLSSIGRKASLCSDLLPCAALWFMWWLWYAM